MLDVRSVLGIPAVYRGFVRLISDGYRDRYAGEYLRVRPGDRVLDLGCGPGDILAHLPACTYLGIDEDAGYIEAARRRFGDRGTFIHGRAESASLEANSFDVIMANGVLHHLDDEQAASVFALAGHALKPGGRFVTLDGCFVPGQRTLARWMLKMDRGRHVRTEPDYVGLARQQFTQVRCDIRHDLIRLPYTHLIMTCTRSEAGA